MDLSNIDVNTFCDLQGGINQENLFFLKKCYKNQVHSYDKWYELVGNDIQLTPKKNFDVPVKSKK